MDLFSRNKFILQLQLYKFYLATGKNYQMTNSPLNAMLNKMSSMQEKEYCVFEYDQTSWVVQRHFRTKFRKESPHWHNISRLVKQFQDTCCLYKNKSPGRKETKPEVVERIRGEFGKIFYGVPQNERNVQVQNWLSVTQRCDVFYGSISVQISDDPGFKTYCHTVAKNFCVKFQGKLDVNGFENTPMKPSSPYVSKLISIICVIGARKMSM